MPVTFKDVLLSEFDHEVAVTRQLLVRVPAAALAWRPHSRSMSLGRLAAHLVEVPKWGGSILDRDGHDLARAEDPPNEDVPIALPALLESFDQQTTTLRRRLDEISDAELSAPWSLTRGDQLLMTMPRVVAVRRFMMNHLIHHRGQLTVYLRLQNVPLPPIYGPTADERL